MDVDESLEVQSSNDSIHSVSKLDAKEKPKLQYIRESQFIYPLSQYDGNVPPLPISKEREVIRDFKELIKQKYPSGTNACFGEDEDQYIEFELSEYSIYLPESNAMHAWEMGGLQNLITKNGHSMYCFDGILSVQGQRRYVQCVPFKLISIGDYGKELDEVTHVWIQTFMNSKSNVYYRLKAPHPHYQRFHDGFIWLANMSKHFVDYSLEVVEAGGTVSIHNFRKDFAEWLHREHDSESFHAWFKQYNNTDFRTAVVSNIEFLAKDAIGTYSLDYLDIWAEVKERTKIPFYNPVEKLTVVTPYVCDCFKHMKFGDWLKKVEPSAQSDFRRKSQGSALNLTMNADFVKEKPELNDHQEDHQEEYSRITKRSLKEFCSRPLDLQSISVGDVLGVKTDGSASRWKDEESKWKEADECWFVYVQGIHTTQAGNRSFDVLWLYKPADTTCGLMKYPHHNEMFLSDNCSCSTSRISENEVLCRVSIAWHGMPGTSDDADFFVRQTYLHDNSFVTFKEDHKQCQHFRNSVNTPLQDFMNEYKTGDTVLVEPPNIFKSNHGLEPCEIVSFIQDSGEGMVNVKRLLRRREVEPDSTARPNELVYTDQIFTIPLERIDHKCLVRFYSQDQIKNNNVPGPYSRDGAGDAFYIATRLIDDANGQRLEEIDAGNPPASLIQGFDPELPPSRRQLRGLDMFCGGGNFGRGLEEGGAIKFTHAIDMEPNAIATYYANAEHPDVINFFSGSVDDMLAIAMQGNPDGLPEVPLPGDIDAISAGSPCVGFSVLNPHKDNDQGFKNQSLIADVAAMIDFYRPKYALLENVLTMAQKGKGRSEDALSQLICCLVGMGYQLQVFVLDAWSFGSAQSRSRLFVSVAAPGLELPPHPYPSHSHPERTSDRGLGMMANGKTFGERKFAPTPFKYVSAAEATEDLPYIGDGQTYHCTPFPDHRMPKNTRAVQRQQIEVIPFNPAGMDFVTTWKNQKVTGMTQADYDLFPTKTKAGLPRQLTLSGSKAFGRVKAKALFPTIVTVCAPENARAGRCLHWNQQRLITIAEAKRAQSFLDEDVLTGSRGDQFRIVGNSVARTVALALGLSHREAWLKNSPDDDEGSDEMGVDEQVRQQIFAEDRIPRKQTRRTVIPDSDDESDESDEQYQVTLEALKLQSPKDTDEDRSSMSSVTSGTAQSTPSKLPLHGDLDDGSPVPAKRTPLPTHASVVGAGNLLTPQTSKRQRDTPPPHPHQTGSGTSLLSPPPSTGNSISSRLASRSRYLASVAARFGVNVEAIRAKRAHELEAKEKAERERMAAELVAKEKAEREEKAAEKAREAIAKEKAQRVATERAERRGSGIVGKLDGKRESPLTPRRTKLPERPLDKQESIDEDGSPRPMKRRRAARAPTQDAGPEETRRRAPQRQKAKKPFVIDLTADSDDERRAREVRPRVYVPVDNGIFEAYERTHNSTLGRRRGSLRKPVREPLREPLREPMVVSDSVNGAFSY